MRWRRCADQVDAMVKATLLEGLILLPSGKSQPFALKAWTLSEDEDLRLGDTEDSLHVRLRCEVAPHEGLQPHCFTAEGLARHGPTDGLAP